MNILPSRLRRAPPAAALRRPAVHVDLVLPDDAGEDGVDGRCGWFDSSQALRDGLAVQELSDSALAGAVLWFDALRRAEAAATASARLQ